MVITLVVVVALLGGLVWMVSSRAGKDGDDSAGRAGDAATTTTTPSSTTAATSTTGQGADMPGPNPPAAATGSKAAFCPLAGDFEQAVVSADQVDGADSPEAAEAVAEQALGTWMILMDATPEAVFSPMVDLFRKEVGAAFWTETEAAFPSSSFAISAREDWELQKAAARPPTSEGSDVAAVREYLTGTC